MDDHHECPTCHRPTWQSTGGMGGGLMPDNETTCLRRGGSDCRVASAGFLRGAAWMLETAKRHAKPSTCERCSVPVPYGTIDWERARCTECGTDVDFTDVDAALEARGKTQ